MYGGLVMCFVVVMGSLVHKKCCSAGAAPAAPSIELGGGGCGKSNIHGMGDLPKDASKPGG